MSTSRISFFEAENLKIGEEKKSLTDITYRYTFTFDAIHCTERRTKIWMPPRTQFMQCFSKLTFCKETRQNLKNDDERIVLKLDMRNLVHAKMSNKKNKQYMMAEWIFPIRIWYGV